MMEDKKTEMSEVWTAFEEVCPTCRTRLCGLMAIGRTEFRINRWCDKCKAVVEVKNILTLKILLPQDQTARTKKRIFG